MPVKVTDTAQRGTSPSKSLDQASQTSWGSQQGTTDPKQALADKHTNHPTPVKGNG